MPLSNEPIQWRCDSQPMAYQHCQAEMEDRVNGIISGELAELIWLLEHQHVYTAGASYQPEEEMLSDRTIPLVITDRGGKMTYHGPGQRICYLLLNLKKWYRQPDIRQFLSEIHGCIINVCARLGVEAFRHDQYPGVWARDNDGRLAKLAAIGMKVRKWVTFHGFALNVDPDMEYFKAIIPCGISDLGVTSLKALGVNVEMAEVDELLKRELTVRFETPLI